MDQFLMLVRGIPGTGKSTAARAINFSSKVVHLEADMFFEQPNGKYEFDASKLYNAHMWCQSTTEDLLTKGENVIVSNTFTTIKELRPYFDIAYRLDLGFPIVLTANGAFTNVHNVPQDKLIQMKNRFVHDLSPLFQEFSVKEDA